jgi:hypothetical protein
MPQISSAVYSLLHLRFIFVGSLVPKVSDPNLLIPVFDRLFCCFRTRASKIHDEKGELAVCRAWCTNSADDQKVTVSCQNYRVFFLVRSMPSVLISKQRTAHYNHFVAFIKNSTAAKYCIVQI